MLFVTLICVFYTPVLVLYTTTVNENKLTKKQLTKRILSLFGIMAIVFGLAKISADYDSKELSGIFAMLSTILMFVQTKIAIK